MPAKTRGRTPNPDSMVREHFRLGASKAYGRLIWNKLVAAASKDGLSGHGVARLAGIDPAAVSAGRRNGTLSFPYLVMLMVSLGKVPCDLPCLPSNETLANHGYIEAMYRVRQEQETLSEVAKLFPEDFKCLLLSFAVAFQKTRPTERCVLAKEIVDKIGGRARLNAILAGNPFTYVTQMQRDWTDAWNLCSDIIKGTVGWTTGATE